MTDAPTDLHGFVDQIRAVCGFTDPNEVGMLPNQAHLSSGGYHCGVQNIRDIGRYDKDYSTRQGRDRIGGNTASAVDIGDNWPHGGRAAWLRFNNTLVAQLRAGDPALSALRGVNFSPDGTARKRYDSNNPGQGVINSTDTVTIHTHLEFWRNTAGTAGRAQTLARVVQLAQAAIGGAPTPTPTTQGDQTMFLVKPGNSSTVYLSDGGHVYPFGPADADLFDYLKTRIPYFEGLAPKNFTIMTTFAKDPAATFTDAQIQAIADRLVASNTNGLTPADHAGIVADLKQALTEGTGA
jgi:hypothetical protein